MSPGGRQAGSAEGEGEGRGGAPGRTGCSPLLPCPLTAILLNSRGPFPCSLPGDARAPTLLLTCSGLGVLPRPRWYNEGPSPALVNEGTPLALRVVAPALEHSPVFSLGRADSGYPVQPHGGESQILLNRGADQERHQKSTNSCSSPTVTRAQRGNNRKHHPVRMRSGQPSAQSWWRTGAGFTTSTTLSACRGQALGRASPPGPADSGLQGSPPSSHISTRWAAPRGTHSFSRVSAHTLQQTGRGPRGTFNTCHEAPRRGRP